MRAFADLRGTFMQELGREWAGMREGLAGRGQEEERAQSDIAALLTRNNGE